MGFSMNEQKPNINAVDEDTDYIEKIRKRRMAARRKKQRRKRFAVAGLSGAALLIVLAAFLLFSQHPSNAKNLIGTWAYEETATVQFSGKDSGTIKLSDTNVECTFSYTVEENTLHIHFDNNYITNASYTFTIENDTLILSGGSGAAGGTYALTKIKEK